MMHSEFNIDLIQQPGDVQCSTYLISQSGRPPNSRSIKLTRPLGEAGPSMSNFAKKCMGLRSCSENSSTVRNAQGPRPRKPLIQMVFAQLKAKKEVGPSACTTTRVILSFVQHLKSEISCFGVRTLEWTPCKHLALPS
jgi:hypothetical protein